MKGQVGLLPLPVQLLGNCLAPGLWVKNGGVAQYNHRMKVLDQLCTGNIGFTFDLTWLPGHLVWFHSWAKVPMLSHLSFHNSPS